MSTTTRLGAIRSRVGMRARELRKERGWTQSELSDRLAISQGRLSRIENDGASFTAEEFLLLLELLNVGISEFCPSNDEDGSLQNALVRFGAFHLRETLATGAHPDHESPSDAVRSTLLAPTSERLVTALSAVLVVSCDRIRLPQLQYDLERAGVPNRLGWVAENTQRALNDLPDVLRKRHGLAVRRAELVLHTFMAEIVPSDGVMVDPFDQGVRSTRSLQRLWASASQLSKRWRIASRLQPADFTAALRESLEHH